VLILKIKNIILMNFQAKNILKSNQYHTPQHPFKVYWVRGYIETF
jgi:hypothetical protein